MGMFPELSTLQIYRNIIESRRFLRIFLRKILIFDQNYRVSRKSLGTANFEYLHHILTKWADIFTTDKGVFIAHIHKRNIEENCFEVSQLTSTRKILEKTLLKRFSQNRFLSKNSNVEQIF